MRMVQEHGGEYSSRWAAVVSVIGKVGCSAHTLAEGSRKPGSTAASVPVTTDMAEELTFLDRESPELRQANEICAKLPHISPTRSSTARSSDDCLH